MKFTFEPDDLDILQGIVEESTEHLKGIEEGILKLEVDFQPALVDSVFRALHSVKGVAGLLDFVPIKETAHSLETLMTGLRKGIYTADAEITDILLRGVDILNLLLRQLGTRVQELVDDPPKEAFDICVNEYGFQEFVLEVEQLRQRLVPETGGQRHDLEINESPYPGDQYSDSAADPRARDFSELLEQMMPDFIAETAEHLDIIEQNCVELEKHPDNPEVLNSIMRGFHSIKGASGVIASMYTNDNPRDPVLAIKALSHTTENLLQAYSRYPRHISAEIVDIILQSVDRLAALTRLLQAGKQVDINFDDLTGRMESLLEAPGSFPANEKEEPEQGTARRTNQLCAFINISRQALESMSSIIQSTVENQPVDHKRIKQYKRALNSLRSTARYLEYSDILQLIEEQLGKLEDYTPKEDAITRERLGFLQAGYEELKQVLDAKISAICKAIQDIPDEYAQKRIGEILVEENKITHQDLAMALGQQKRLGEILVETGAANPADVAVALTKQSIARDRFQATTDEVRTPAELTGQSIRVSQEKLDRLMNMIGELLISKNRIFHLASRISQHYNLPALSREVKGVAAEIGRISDELQDAIMSARMVPLRILFQRYHRTIRDISRKAGKTVDLIITGEDTELDKSVVEAINDPLVHMLRNAVDHGIESPEERQMQGKSMKGTINISAYYQAGHVVIEIADDGRGLNPEQIKLKALTKGLIQPQHIENISDEEAYSLIFSPGFSTRDEVTELSGRGVGMDVVKSNIERVGGTVSVGSVLGEGTTFTLKIPLSMSIIQGLIVETAGQQFIIALDNIVETVKLPYTRIRRYKRNLVADIRGEILPLVYLKDILGIENNLTCTVLDKYSDSKRVPIVILDIGVKLGLIVDRFQNQQEFVIKSLSEELAGLKVYTGATILGDGSVVLILNPPQLLQMYLTQDRGVSHGLDHCTG